MKNYIVEINNFYEFLDSHKLSTGQISLWHGLMHICNKARWSQTFTVSNKVLEAVTGLSRTAILKNRDVLKELGLINFITNGTKATVYHMINVPSAQEDTVQEQQEAEAEENTKEVAYESMQEQPVYEEMDIAKSVQINSYNTADMSESVQVSNFDMSKSDTLNKHYMNNTIIHARATEFIKPSVEQVEQYCQEKGYTHISPNVWHAHYRSVGWYISGVKMVDWKASVDCWEYRETAKLSKNRQPSYYSSYQETKQNYQSNYQQPNYQRTSTTMPKNKFFNFEQRNNDYQKLLDEYFGYADAGCEYAIA